MGIHKDSLVLLSEFYNAKVERKQFKLDDVFKKLDFPKNRFLNAYEHLEGKNLVKHAAQTMGRSEKGIPNYLNPKITETGVEIIEDEQEIRHTFGKLGVEFDEENGTVINVINVDGQGNVVNMNKGHSQTATSNPKIADSKIKGNGNYIGNVNTTQVLTDKSVTYRINKKKLTIAEMYSQKIINKFGEKPVTITGIVSFVSGIYTLVAAFKSYSPDNQLWKDWWFLLSSQHHADLILWIGIGLTAIGAFLLAVIKYKKFNKCSKCGEHYTLDEVGHGERKETPTHEGMRVETTRNYKCNKCEFTEPVVDTEIIDNER